MQMVPISEIEFDRFRQLIQSTLGIQLVDQKRPMLCSRLQKRLDATGCQSYTQYFNLVTSADGRGELQKALDLVTTNETYFYREPAPLEWLVREVFPQFSRQRPPRIWSAASSSGEEPYTVAMLMAEHFGLGRHWQLLASDISERILQMAQRGLYPQERCTRLPQALLHKYCLKGTHEFSGKVLVDRTLREQVKFARINLVQALPNIGEFDVILLRNVMIYFDQPTKRQVVNGMLDRLAPGGMLLSGNSESLQSMGLPVRMVHPTVYRHEPTANEAAIRESGANGRARVSASR
jgi:chemotaxis protein methyltransferase CheR